MTEADLFKILLNNGFMALFVVWVLFKGEPRYRELIDKMQATHKDTIEKLTTDHKAVVDTVMKSHEAVIANLHRECRDERRETMASIAKEGELNRESRHQFANTLQKAIMQVYEGSAKDRSKNNKGPNNE